MAEVKEKDFTCAYKHCLHHGERVKDSESVVFNRRHYHWDCAGMKQEISACVNMYINSNGDKTQFPAASRIVNDLVFKYNIPAEFVRKMIEINSSYYKGRPPYSLYGIRKCFFEREFSS